MPKRRPAASAPPATPRDGKIERIEIVQEWRKDGKAKLKTPKLTTIFRPHVAQPKIQGRHVNCPEREMSAMFSAIWGVGRCEAKCPQFGCKFVLRICMQNMYKIAVA